MEVEIGPNTRELIEQLAHQLGKTTEEVWPWLVRQQYVSVAIEALSSVALIGAAYLSFKITRHYFTIQKEQPDDYYNATIAGSFIVGVLCAIFGLINVVCLINVAGALVNPDYYALKDFMAMVRK